MMRRIVGVVALAAVITTGAQAQSPFTAKYSAGSVRVTANDEFAGFQGQFLSPSNPALTGVLNSTSFQVFCVDESHFFNPGDTYDVWVTPMSSSDFSKTRGGAGSQAEYFASANLASNLVYPGAAGGDAATDNLQYAIWETMGMSVSTGLEDYNATTIANDIATKSSGQGIFPNQWLVITMVNPNDNSCFLGGDRKFPCEQEFIYQGPGRPQEFTPEPGTMAMLATGLVGMAGVGLRRRKRK